MDREHRLQRETMKQIEERNRIQEEHFRQEKIEIRNEKEFFEKIRIQALCPGCLKLVPPTPVNQERIQGDGLDIAHLKQSIQPISTSTNNNYSHWPLRDEYMNQEAKFLNKMISDYYGPEIFKL